MREKVRWSRDTVVEGRRPGKCTFVTKYTWISAIGDSPNLTSYRNIYRFLYSFVIENKYN